MKFKPISELTEYNKQYIGKVYTYPCGTTNTVVGWTGKVGYNIVFAVKCHKCEQDYEMYGDGVFENTISQIKKRPICGCNKKFILSDKQKVVRLNRVFENKRQHYKCLDIFKEGKYSRCLINCSICKEDTELYGNGDFIGYEMNLLSGQLCCGCDRSYKYSEEQCKIIVERRCKELNYSFKGWYNDIYKGAHTRIRLENEDVCWDTVTVSNFARQISSPPHKTQSSQTRRNIKAYNKFIKDNYIRPEYKVSFYDQKGKVFVECSICKNDVYARELGSDYRFLVNIASLKANHTVCRCSHCYRLSEKEYEFKVTMALKERGARFIKFLSDDVNNRTYVRFYCQEGHKCRAMVSSIIRGSRNCLECHKNDSSIYGYFKNRVLEEDNLYVILFKKLGILKVGRTFELNERLKSLAKQAGCKVRDLKIITVMHGIHQDVWDTEQWVHEELIDRGFHAEWIKWTTEAFTLDSEDMIKILLTESCLTSSR